ncbi:MAG: sugar ABC transporter permease [Gammaproteobacteria bacterium]|nr:sugar ABC transporter permease [Gammaproteobacteria bacterium]
MGLFRVQARAFEPTYPLLQGAEIAVGWYRLDGRVAVKPNPWLPYLLLGPAGIFVLVFFVYPFLQVFFLAFQDSAGQWSLENFRVMVDDFNFAPSLINTLMLCFAVVPVQICLALVMAMMISRVDRGRDTLLYIWTIPLGISDLAAGIIWLSILEQSGFFNSLLGYAGLIDQPLNWLNYQNPVALFFAVVVAEIWRATAIVLVILVAGVGLIPKEYNEAAEVFGAGTWRRFFTITLPLLRPSLQSALILRTLLAFEVFAVVLILGGIDLPVLMGESFKWQFEYRDAGVAATYAVVILGISIAFTLLFLWALRVPEEAQG